MARDRKRSKARRRTPGGNPARSSRARDMGLDDPAIDEAGLGDVTPTPDPLKNISAEVDQAKAAEAGAVRGGPGEVEAGPDALSEEELEDFERAPDEVEGDLVPAARGPIDPAIAAEQAALRRPRKERGKVLTFLRNSAEELRRVQWPDRRHTGQATAVTLGFVVVAGGFLGLMDAIWKPIVNAII